MKPVLIGTLSLLVCLAGCNVQLDETNYVAKSEDIVAWSQTAEARQGRILLGSDITPTSAVDVARKILVLDDSPEIQRITLIINSNGGDTSALRTIDNALRFTDKPVDAVNAGNCYSAACAIFAVATGKRYTYANGHFMVHIPQATGHAVRRYRDLVDFEVDYFESVLREKGLPRDWFPLTTKDCYFTAQEALDYGFVDQIIQRLPADD